MAYTQQQLDALNAAIANGAEEVWDGDRKIKYRSRADMIAIRNEMQAQLAPTTKRSGRIAVEYSKGI